MGLLLNVITVEVALLLQAQRLIHNALRFHFQCHPVSPAASHALADPTGWCVIISRQAIACAFVLGCSAFQCSVYSALFNQYSV